MMRQITGATIAFSLIGPILPASAEPRKNGDIIVYSDVCIHDQTGDLLGTRIVLLRFPEGDYVHFQLAEGVMVTPQVAKADIRADGTLGFRVLGPQDKLVVFDGRITDKNLTGSFERGGWETISGDAIFSLPRVDIAQVGFPLCK